MRIERLHPHSEDVSHLTSPEHPPTAATVHPVPAFDEVFRSYAPYVFRVLRRLGVARADVDDVLQEVFVTVHRRLGDFEGRAAVKTWVYGICLRTAANHRRKAHRRYEIATAEPPDHGSADTPHQSAERRQALDALDRALACLDDAHREVFVLFEIEQLTMAEVADAVGCPRKTAYSRLYAARARVESAMRATTEGER